MRTLLIVRTHKSSEAAVLTFDRYKIASGLDVTFVSDERRHDVDLDGRRKIVMNRDSIAALGLYAHPQCGWRCGDYAYYTARQAEPDYDYYWLIEPDVLLNMKDLAGFFAKWEEDRSDLVLIKLGPQASGWAWYGTVADKFDTVYGCVYSVSRMSAHAIDTLLAERQRASVGMTDDMADTWPNDEAFTATTAMALGLNARDFNSADKTFYTNESFRNGAVFDRQVIEGNGPDDLIYHPVRPMRRWLEFSYRVFAEMREITKRREVSALTRYGRVLLEQPEFRDAAIVPLMQARKGWANETWEDYTHTIGDDGNRAEGVTRLIHQNFGPGKDRPRIGTAYAAISPVSSNIVRRVGPADFTLEDGVPLGSIARELALPYCWNLETRELLCTIHIRPADVLDKPFLYGAQRDQARVVVSIPLVRLNDLFGEPDAEAPFIFVLSPGRTGSTLFHSLLQCVVPRAVSEPDTLTQLAAEQDIWRDDPGLAKRLLWHSVSAFRHTYIEDAEAGPVAIKARSQVNGILPHLVRIFPKATFVFLTRERTAWARSTFRAFGMSPEDVAGRLRQSVNTIDRLKKARPDATILDYDAIVADPVGSVEAIIGRTATDVERTALLAVMQRDSQAGTNVARDRTEKAATDEEKWLVDFEAAWEKGRPKATIERLGLAL